jgi:PHD/YefM family antitoxin component YafN of YafNO toxin-antitoxin module
MHTITRETTAREFRTHLASMVNEVAFGHGRVGLWRYGELVAVLIGVDDFRLLRRLEDDPGAREVETLDEWAARIRTSPDAATDWPPTGTSVPTEYPQGV